MRKDRDSSAECHGSRTWSRRRAIFERCHSSTEAQADINAMTPRFGTALHAAACNGFLSIVELLLENGANVKLRGGEYETPLIAAIISMAGIPSYRSYDFERWEKIVQVLLVKGVDVDVRSEKLGTALEAASRGEIMLYKPKKLLMLYTM